jgi:hypothetical protein
MSAATDTGDDVGDGVALAVGETRTTLEAAGADVAGAGVVRPTGDGDVPHAVAKERARPTAITVRIRILNAPPWQSVRSYHRRTPDREVTKFRDDLLWLLRHTCEALDGLSEQELNWRPAAKDANSLLVLATHTLGAAEAHILELLAGLQIDRVRAREFAVTGGNEQIRAKLEDVARRITETLDRLDPSELDRERPTPGGRSTGREVLLWAVLHASQHHGVAQLTRDLVLGARPAR